MNITGEKDNGDGTVTLFLDVTEEEENLLIQCGMQDIIDNEYDGKVKILPITDALLDCLKDAKRWELTDEEAHFFFEHGFIVALKRGMELAEKMLL